jgi:hypothetical protein
MMCIFIVYTPPNIIKLIKYRGMRRVGHTARMGEMRNMYKILVEKPEGKIPLGAHRRIS